MAQALTDEIAIDSIAIWRSRSRSRAIAIFVLLKREARSVRRMGRGTGCCRRDRNEEITLKIKSHRDIHSCGEGGVFYMEDGGGTGGRHRDCD